MKKLLNSDWPRVLQFNCNTTAKSVTPVRIVILRYDGLTDNREFSKTMVLHKMMTKILCGRSFSRFRQVIHSGHLNENFIAIQFEGKFCCMLQ